MFRKAILVLWVFVLGSPVLTLMSPASQTAWAQTQGSIIPIYQIQGRGAISPYYQQWVDSYGVVTAVVADGFYLQDPVGDGDPLTSDGIFVYTRNAPTVVVGQCVQLQRGYVDEFYEKTELSRAKSIQPTLRCPATTITPAPLPPARLGQPPATIFEPYEGMVVAVTTLEGVVQGPTKHFATGERELGLIARPLLPYVAGSRVFQADATSTGALLHLTNELGATLPEAGWGDLITLGDANSSQPTRAILDYNFGKYQLLLWPDTPLHHQPADHSLEVATPTADDEVTVCTFNLYGFGQGSEQYTDPQAYDQALAKRARTIAEILQGCTIIGLQETGTPDDAARLADLLRTAYGLDYTATALAGPGTQSLEFPLTNSLLTRRDRVQVLDATSRQGCSGQNYDVAVVLGACPSGEYALFNRPPLVVDLAIHGAWDKPLLLTVIVNHWKSKGGDETVNVVRRTDQARHVASLVQEKVNTDPQTNVIVLGDLNDYYQSGPVTALQNAVAPPLVHTYDLLPDLDRYTYIFDGASQVLDHMLVTPGLQPMLAEINSIHVNADFPAGAAAAVQQLARSSDHDPVLLRLRPAGAAILGGNLHYPGITVQVTRLESDAGPAAMSSPITTTTDELGDFRLWNLTPGKYQLQLLPPDDVTIAAALTTVELVAGYQAAPPQAVTHQQVQMGAALAGVAPLLQAQFVSE
ncbi:MAG: endonuclease/exonuclease/phosphatase family protein [Caldilineaceae bacterium]